MNLKDNGSSEFFVGQKISLMLDRTPAWPHVWLGGGQISSISDKHIRIDGTLNDFGLNGTFLYEIVRSNPGASSVRLKISSNRLNIDCTKEASCIEMGAKRLVFFQEGEFKRLVSLDYRDGCSMAPEGVEVFSEENTYDFANYRIHIEYDA